MPDSDTQTAAGGEGGGPGGTPPDWQQTLFNEFKNDLLDSVKPPAAEVERWSRFSLLSAVLSFVAVLAACIVTFLVAVQFPANTWSDKAINIGMVSSVASVLSTAFNFYFQRNLEVARKQLDARRYQIEDLTRRLFKRLFGASGELAVVTYADSDAVAGRFIKVDSENWREESFLKDSTDIYQFKFSRREGNRVFLRDNSRPRRNLEIQFDLEFKRVIWIDLRKNKSKELYRIVDTD